MEGLIGMKKFIKKYFDKRRDDLRVDNLRVWAKMMLRRSKSLKRSSLQQGHDRFETFISQANVIQSRTVELANDWGLELSQDEVEYLLSIQVDDFSGVEELSNYLLSLYDKLEKRHQLSPLNARFLFFPLTVGEVVFLLMLLVIITVI